MTSNDSHFVLVVLKLSCYVKNSIALRIEDKLLVSNTVYKTLINVTVDLTPLRRHLRVNKDERTCTPVLPTYSFSKSSNKDANLNKT